MALGFRTFESASRLPRLRLGNSASGSCANNLISHAACLGAAARDPWLRPTYALCNDMGRKEASWAGAHVKCLLVRLQVRS